MVYQSPKRSPLTSETKSPFRLSIYFVVFLLVAAGVYGVLSSLFPKESEKDKEVELTTTEVEVKKDLSELELPEFIDLQPTVDSWESSLSKDTNIGLKIYDLTNKKVAAEKNAEEVFSTASIYKMFIIYEGYKEIESGELSSSAPCVAGKTISECLDLAIRESNSPCAESLWEIIGRKKIEDIIKNEYKLENSSAENFSTTPSDIIKLLEIYYYHKDISEPAWEKIKDSLLNQPLTPSDDCNGACNFRSGLPSGFSDSVKVYNKVGYESSGAGLWKIYNDTAILEFPELGRTYFIAVFTENLPWSDKKIEALNSLASSLEEKIKN